MNGYNSMEVIILHGLKDATPDKGRGNCSVDFATADWQAQHWSLHTHKLFHIQRYMYIKKKQGHKLNVFPLIIHWTA